MSRVACQVTSDGCVKTGRESNRLRQKHSKVSNGQSARRLVEKPYARASRRPTLVMRRGGPRAIDIKQKRNPAVASITLVGLLHSFWKTRRMSGHFTATRPSRHASAKAG